MNRDQIALQLYTVRDQTALDFSGTVRQVAAAGYTAVEFAGYGNLSSAEINALLTETGLRAASTHVGLPLLESDLAGQIEFCQGIGCTHLVLPWLPPELRGVEAIRALLPRMNEFGRQCRTAGIRFSYHNHDFEFQTVDGGLLLDLLLDATDPELVSLELDVYWAAYAGQDPIAYMQRRSDRIRLVHMKDMAPAPDRNFTEVGDGVLDLRSVIAAAESGGAEWLIVENDAPRIGSLASAQRSLQNLQAMLSV